MCYCLIAFIGLLSFYWTFQELFEGAVGIALHVWRNFWDVREGKIDFNTCIRWLQINCSHAPLCLGLPRFALDYSQQNVYMPLICVKNFVVKCWSSWKKSLCCILMSSQGVLTNYLKEITGYLTFWWKYHARRFI